MSKIFKSFTFLLFLFIHTATLCYNFDIDSMRNLLGDENDTSNYLLYTYIAGEYLNRDLDSALYYEQLGLDQATRQNNLKYIERFLNHFAVVYGHKGWHNLSIEYSLKSLERCKLMGDSVGITIALNNIGAEYLMIGKFDKASSFLYKALEQAESQKDTSILLEVNFNLGQLHKNLGRNNLAIEFYNKTLEYSRYLNDSSSIAYTYQDLGMMLVDQNNLDSALYYYTLSLQINESTDNFISLFFNIHNICHIHIQRKEAEKVYKYIEKTEEISSILHSDITSALTANLYGEYYKLIENGSKALNYFHKSLSILKRQESYTDLKDSYQTLSDFHKSVLNYDSALYYFELAAAYKDSTFSLEKTEQIAELETIYQTEKKEKEILQLAKDKEQKQSQILLLSGFIGLLIILIVFTYIYYKTRQKSLVLKAITSEQKKQFKAVLGAQENERKRIAAELHDSVGPLLSVSQLYISELGESGNQPETESKQLCNKSLNALKEATQEIRDISHNLMPGVLVRIGLGAACRELIRKINDTKNHTISFELIGYKKRLDETIELTFYRIFQELLNNILKHSKADKVEVNLLQKNSTLSLTVKDNGVGFNTKNMSKAKGIGLQSIYSRISLIGGEIKIDSGEKGTRTKVWVEI